MIVLLIILLLILVNGFFAASEMALVSITPADLHRLKEEGLKNAKKLEQVTTDSTVYLSTIQVAITFAGFLSSAVAGSNLSGYVIEFFQTLDITLSEGVVVVLITIVLSFITLVFGELVPKKIAMNLKEGFALKVAPIIYICMMIFKPFVYLLTGSTNIVLRLFGFKNNNDDESITESEIKELIVYGHIKGLYQTEETNMIKRIFKFDDIKADMIMTPIKDVVSIDMNNITTTSITDVIKTSYSRVPLYKGHTDNIKGYIVFKDILPLLTDKKISDIHILDYLREPTFIDGDMTINHLFKKMKDENNHFVFVENNNTIEGIVTMEDIVEEIFGNIYDEHDSTLDKWYEKNGFSYIIEGEMMLSEVCKTLEIDYNYSTDQTIHEYVLEKIEEPLNIELVFNCEIGRIRIIELEGEYIKKIKLIITND